VLVLRSLPSLPETGAGIKISDVNELSRHDEGRSIEVSTAWNEERPRCQLSGVIPAAFMGRIFHMVRD
jgi:hypothetical protein